MMVIAGTWLFGSYSAGRAFMLVQAFTVSGMSVKEPYIALGVCAMWGLYGGIYFLRASKAKSKSVLVTEKPATQVSRDTSARNSDQVRRILD